MENILIPGGKLELNEITANKEKNTISYLSQIYDIDEDTGRVDRKSTRLNSSHSV